MELNSKNFLGMDKIWDNGYFQVILQKESELPKDQTPIFKDTSSRQK